MTIKDVLMLVDRYTAEAHYMSDEARKLFDNASTPREAVEHFTNLVTFEAVEKAMRSLKEEVINDD